MKDCTKNTTRDAVVEAHPAVPVMRVTRDVTSIPTRIARPARGASA